MHKTALTKIIKSEVIHMKLWGGRFTKEENQLVHNFNESLSFDQKFYKQDIQGSLAHVKMLGKDRKSVV